MLGNDRKIIGISGAAALLIAISLGMAGCEEQGAGYSIDRKTVDGLPTVTATATAQASAKVDAIDYDNRSIALTGPNGKTEIFTAPAAVRNFAQIKKGDTVKVDYASRVFASVKKGSEEPTTSITSYMNRAELGEKPGIVLYRKAVIEAKVEAIDYKTRVVKLRTTSGDLMTLTADEKLKDLDKVQAGDQVVFDYTEAVTISVN